MLIPEVHTTQLLWLPTSHQHLMTYHECITLTQVLNITLQPVLGDTGLIFSISVNLSTTSYQFRYHHSLLKP